MARSLPGLLAGAFMYPFRGTTVMWLVAVLVATTFLQFIPLVGGLVALSAELGFLFAVLRSTAGGADTLRIDARDIADVSLWLAPLGKYVMAMAVSFAPAVVAAVLLGDASGAVSPVVYGAGAVGLLYFPAALVVAAHSQGCLGALNPLAGIALIGKIPGAYVLTVFFVAIALGVGGGMLRAAAAIEVPLLGAIVRSVAALYAPVVAMRLLGLLLAENAEHL
ncbi:MAG: hypothetical protein KF819_16525 [Labilithrix sp.]|nr:hypothetical protein [Labilithrix sp.]